MALVVFEQLRNVHLAKMKGKWVGKRANGESSRKIMNTTSFSNNILYILRLMTCLLQVWKLVNSEKNQAMGCVDEAMDRAKDFRRSQNG